jgi:hypothetical protein
MSARTSPFATGRKPNVATLKDAATAAADILAHLVFLDERDAEHARTVEQALRTQLRKKGGAR